MNVTAQWLALPHHIQKVWDSNFNLVTNCPEFYHGFPQSFQGNAGIVT